ncbi:hypothetical protein BSY48_004427 [Salmonella enterica subsp. enterica serovar Agbeni]|nr:hypothetical protein [Salmonella enterica subsp. enterica serovar Agbeni]
MTDTEIDQTAEAAKNAVNKVIASKAVVTAITNAIAANTSANSVICLQDMAVDTFIGVSSYENNRDVADRAKKQAKKGGTAHHTSGAVAIAELDPERNKALWERTEKAAKDQGIPHTLPFIKVDGHTRSYGWSNPSTATVTHGETVNGVFIPDNMFKRPDYLLITVYRGMTDDQIHELVHNYCDGLNKANNKELQQMGMKKVCFDPQTNFVKKDSWKTAFRTITRDNNKKSMETLIELYQSQLSAVDALNVDTFNTAKKLSGVRAALITTYTEKDCDKWLGFWEDFYQTEPTHKAVDQLVKHLGELKTGDAAGALALCTKAFTKFKPQ